MNSINISNSKLISHNVDANSDSKISFSTLSSTITDYFAAGIDGPEFKIISCNYLENKCKNLFLSNVDDAHIINCSFYKNTVRERYFDVNDGQMLFKGCYFDTMIPSVIGLTITENVSSIYPENRHISTFLCYAKQKTKADETLEDIKVNNKRNHKFSFMFCVVSLIPK